MRLQDYFYYVEQAVSIGTKGVIMDFLADGSGIAFGKVAETSGYVEFGWPLKLTEPLEIAQGGTGASTAAGARAALGAVNKAGDTMTGNLTIQGYLYPSVYLTPYYNSTTNRTVFEGSYVGASSFASWEDSTGNNRRMLEVRTKGYEASLDNAVMLHNQYFEERFRDENNYNFVGAYIDITGNRNIRQRPEMIRLLRDCLAGRIDVIYTQTKAYLAANSREFFYLLKFIFELEHRVEIITEDTEYNINTIINAENQVSELRNMVNRYSALNPGDYSKWKAEILKAIRMQEEGKS